MTNTQEATPIFNNQTQITVKYTNKTHIMLLGIIITMSHSVDSSDHLKYDLDISQFKSNKVDLSENSYMATKLLKKELNTTSVVVLTSLLDIIYGIYPILSESAKQEMILKFPAIENSMDSIYKESSSFLPKENFTILNYSILTCPIEYNKTYVSILEDKYKLKFKNITESSVKEQVITLNQEIFKATNGDITNFFTEEILKGSEFLLLSIVTFNLEWAYSKLSEGTDKKKFTISEDREEHTTIDFMRFRHVELDFLGQFKKNGKMFWLYEKPLLSEKETSMFFIMLVNKSEGKLSDLDDDDTMLKELCKNRRNMRNIDEDDIMKSIFSSSHSYEYNPISDLYNNYEESEYEEGGLYIIKEREDTFISIPKFKSSKRNDFKRILKCQGITEIFNANRDPLEKFSKDRCFIEKFYQEVVINVSEEGVKGSAATTAVSLSRNSSITRLEVDFNRPFRYGIKVEGRLVLVGSFYGTQ